MGAGCGRVLGGSGGEKTTTGQDGVGLPRDKDLILINSPIHTLRPSHQIFSYFTTEEVVWNYFKLWSPQSYYCNLWAISLAAPNRLKITDYNNNYWWYYMKNNLVTLTINTLNNHPYGFNKLKLTLIYVQHMNCARFRKNVI